MTASDTTLGQLVAAYELAQRNRIATGAHIRAAHRRADANGDGQHADSSLDVLYRTERDTEKHLANAMARSVECTCQQSEKVS